MSTSRTLLDVLTAPAALGSSKFSIKGEIPGGFVGRAPSSCACLLIPTAVGGRAIGRVSGRLRVSFRPSVSFDIQGRQWEAPCAIIECLDDVLLPAFVALSVDVSERLHKQGMRPSPAQVAAALADWERLLRSGQRLSDAEELGLWGELALIDSLVDVDVGIRAWQGPFGATIDFVAAGIGVECKTSRERLRHHVSYDQLQRPLGDFPIYVASLWVGIDPERGRSLAELIDRVGSRTAEFVAFERALLATGYSRVDVTSYVTKFVLLEAPHWFAEADIPRIREMDPGIVRVRYMAQLDEVRSIDEPLLATSLGVFTPRI